MRLHARLGVKMRGRGRYPMRRRGGRAKGGFGQVTAKAILNRLTKGKARVAVDHGERITHQQLPIPLPSGTVIRSTSGMVNVAVSPLVNCGASTLPRKLSCAARVIGRCQTPVHHFIPNICGIAAK